MDLSTEWKVGGNGNYFRDMNGARYCVAHMQETYNTMGDWRWRFQTLRNGVVFGGLQGSANNARIACEKHANATAGIDQA